MDPRLVREGGRADEGLLREASGSHYWAQPQHPSHRVGLRTMSDDTYTIIETTGGHQVIGQVDDSNPTADLGVNRQGDSLPPVG